jgi:predicted tellurium resistance membrane protein TerC
MSKPPAKYFFATCIEVVVWGIVCSLKEQKRRVGIITGLVGALVIQQVAFHVWRSEMTGIWWPLVQFLSLQCVVVSSLSSSPG